MTITSTGARACHGCSQPVPAGYEWHQDCLATYRASHDYRAETIRRDGYACASCPPWWNRMVLAYYGGALQDDSSLTAGWRNTGWRTNLPEFGVVRPTITRQRNGKRTLRVRKGRLLRKRRWVQADHIIELADGGTHDAANLQVLCQGRPFLHHPRKTARSQRKRKGVRRLEPNRYHAITAGIGLGALSVHAFGVNLWVILAGFLLTLGLVARYAVHRKIRARLHASYVEVTGDAVTHVRHLRARKWRFKRVDGLQLPRLRPTVQEIRYPHTFEDSDPDKQAKLEDRVIAKTGGTWTAKWYTSADKVVLVSPDPLEALGGTPWPNLHAEQISVWDPIPLAMDENGDPMMATIIGKNILTGGEPEAGKSVFQSQFTATFAMDPTCLNYAMDFKEGIELGFWESSMDGPLVTDRASGIVLLDYIIGDIIEVRARELRNQNLRKIERDMGMSPVGLTIDELALATVQGGTTAQKQEAALFTERLRDVISRGRALGVICNLATQRPSAKVLDTDVRDLIGYRAALRCNTASASNMILGDGWASEGCNAARLSSSQRGSLWLYAEGSRPRRGRSYWISDDDLRALSARAAALRSGGRGVVGSQAG